MRCDSTPDAHARESESRDRYRRHGLPFHHHLLLRGVRNFIAPPVRCSRQEHQEKTTKAIEGARAHARSNCMLRSILKPIKTRDKAARTSARNIHLLPRHPVAPPSRGIRQWSYAARNSRRRTNYVYTVCLIRTRILGSFKRNTLFVQNFTRTERITNS